MREIKFRFVVKDNYGNISISSDYTWTPENGLPCEEAILEDMENCTCTFNESVNHCEGECIRFDKGEVLNKLQYIGLKDKNGKEIYEGDIVKEKVPNTDIIRTGQILWKDSCYLFQGKYPFCIVGGEHHLEIIGNIYENPELLKEIGK